jgi:proteasome accessory factor C
MDNKSLLRMLNMIADLGKENGISVRQLTRKYNVSNKSIYRNIETLRDAGFMIRKMPDYRYKIEKYNASLFEEGILSFSVQEASLIKDALLAAHSQHPLKNQTLSKLFALSEINDIVEIIYDQKTGEILRVLKEAITEKKQVKLYNYRSSNSNTIRDRIIEPVSFHKNMKYIFAFDTGSKEVKQFKAERAERAELLQQNYQYSHLHSSLKPDHFGMNGNPAFIVDMKLNIRAANLLKEEFPLAEKDIRELSDRKSYMYSAPCKGYEGVGRFVMGLPGQIQVLGDEDFIKYLQKQTKSFTDSIRTKNKAQ